MLLAYSARNRSASCRIPWTSNPKAKRVEVRFPDPTANPYLAFAAMLMAGLDGIANKIDPGAAMDKDLYDLPPKELKKIPTVCGSLREALTNLDKDRAFLKAGDVFSDDFIDSYIELKMADVLSLRNDAASGRVRHVLFATEPTRSRDTKGRPRGRPFSFGGRRGDAEPARGRPSWTAPAIGIILRRRGRRAATGGADDDASQGHALARSSIAAARRRRRGRARRAELDRRPPSPPTPTTARRWRSAGAPPATSSRPTRRTAQDNVPPFATIAKIPGFDANSDRALPDGPAPEDAGHAAVARRGGRSRRLYRPPRQIAPPHNAAIASTSLASASGSVKATQCPAFGRIVTWSAPKLRANLTGMNGSSSPHSTRTGAAARILALIAPNSLKNPGRMN